ncbi:DUF1214 domain-containing protein [Thalassotalea nanhaiensis]|uniref:DUF1214 domain-containing protein n=1 Tax=Thalassotalea nanhaiensis TaxID=3065648 RepID=A0ABY9TGW7_9GAMM|nr:DUF1214 domain-containing protein [Colwelliaceae bacterium SQ345]
MKKILLASLLTLSAAAMPAMAESFNDTNDILKRSAQIENLQYKIMVQRATQTAIHYMPAVTQTDFLKATRRNFEGGGYNDVVYVNKPFGSEKGFLTANDTTAYAWGTLTSKNGPIVIEVPAATDKLNYFGSVVSQWEVPITDVGYKGADKGKGGKYVFLPPGYDNKLGTKSDLEKKGYLVFETDTYLYGFSFRPSLTNGATDKDAGDYAQTIKIYNLADAAKPPKTDYLDATDVAYDSLPYYNESFFQDVNEIIQENPIRTQDKAMASLLKDLGIVKGSKFAPTEQQKKAMKDGLLMAYAHMQSKFVEPDQTVSALWRDKDGKALSQWSFWNFGPQAQLGFPFIDENEVLVDKRAASYFYVTYLPKQLGGSTFYLTGLRDSNGEMLDGNATYKLNVPADTPAEDFWSAIVYNMETKNFVKNVERVGLSSRNADEMIKNSDGSYDLYFGPEAPKGQEANWVPTGGEDYFLLFRLYRPTSKTFFKNWMLNDMVKISD